MGVKQTSPDVHRYETVAALRLRLPPHPQDCLSQRRFGWSGADQASIFSRSYEVPIVEKS